MRRVEKVLPIYKDKHPTPREHHDKPTKVKTCKEASQNENTKDLKDKKYI